MTQPPMESAVMLSPTATAVAADNAMAARPIREKWRIAMLALPGGAWIALGFVLYVTSQTGMTDVPFGATKILGGVVFSIGLLLVIVTGADLFTSTTMTLIPLTHKRITWGALGIHWVIVWIGNLIGALGIVALCYYGDLQNMSKGGWGKVILAGAETKLSHTWWQEFTLGIFANLAVCLAVWMAFAGKTLVDKAAAVVGPVCLFVSTGMEHSVANMFYLPYAAILKDANPFKTPVDMAAYPHVTWENVFLHNLLPVTLGNIIGGGIIAGVYQFYANRPKVEPATMP